MTDTAPRLDRPAVRPRVQLAGLGWERVQCVISGRLIEGSGALDPASFRLCHRAGIEGGPASGATMAPTRGERTGDAVRLRFNVMAGPDQMPLEPGRWRLEHAGAPLPVDTGDAELEAAVATFSLARGTYRVTPRHDPREAALWLDVDLVVTAAGRSALGPTAGPVTRWRRRTVSRVRKTVFRALYRVARRLGRRSGRRILFASDSRAELGGNLQVVWDRMVERGLGRQYDLRTLFKPSIADRRSMADRLRLPWLLATSDVILIDDYLPAIYGIDDPEVRIIQLWHASGAFKTVGYSRVGKPGGPSPFSRIHKNYTFAIVSSDHDVPFYAEAFGIPEARVVPTGIPRMDRFFEPAARGAGRELAYRLFPAARGRMVILFAPTFRGDARTASYDMGRLDLAALHALAVERDAVVIFKMHPFVREPVDVPAPFRDRLIDGTTAPIDVNDLLFIVDLLVTDYSSIVFEYSTLGGPMLFFAYDLDEYIAERDFYVPFEAFVPGRIVRTFPELLDAIRRGDFEADKVPVFAAEHFDHLDGTSTDRVIDELVLAP